MLILRPMLACNIPQVGQLRFPLYASPKIDGIRCILLNSKALSRSFKPIPNLYVRNILQQPFLQNIILDGELVVGNNFQQTTSGVMTQDDTKIDFQYMIFDCILDHPNTAYFIREQQLKNFMLSYTPQLPKEFCLLKNILVQNQEELDMFEVMALSNNYEGVILRAPQGRYKSGRSTFSEQYLMKLKRFTDAEAIIIDFVEQQHNENPSTVSNLGLAKRSSHKANQLLGNTLGALVVRDCKSGIEFKIGSGFSSLQRDKIWQNREQYKNVKVKYKYQKFGIKEKPRSPIFVGVRKD